MSTAGSSSGRATHGDSVLEVRGLCASAGGREVLRGVDLTVRSGEVQVVMGPNGSGKSTLAHALMGRPGTEVTAGSVTMNGAELTRLPAWRRARAGLFLALQNPIEVPGVKLLSLLAAAAADGVGLQNRLLSEAEAVGLDALLLSRPLNVGLSGGERKRTEMVQLGVLRPSICILDEIDSGLDVDALGEVARRLQQATTEWGLGIVAITHFSRFLEQFEADVVHVMVEGRIVATGDAALALELERTGYAAYQGTS